MTTQAPSKEIVASDPNKLPEDVRQKLLLIRTALVHGDESEANHWLYSIACPAFTCFDPWAALEGRQCACGPHSLAQHSATPTVDELESVYDGKPASAHEPATALPWGDGTREMLIELRDWMRSRMPCNAGDCCNELRNWIERVDKSIIEHSPAASPSPPPADTIDASRVAQLVERREVLSSPAGCDPASSGQGVGSNPTTGRPLTRVYSETGLREFIAEHFPHLELRPSPPPPADALREIVAKLLATARPDPHWSDWVCVQCEHVGKLREWYSTVTKG